MTPALASAAPPGHLLAIMSSAGYRTPSAAVYHPPGPDDGDGTSPGQGGNPPLTGDSAAPFLGGGHPRPATGAPAALMRNRAARRTDRRRG